MKILFTNTWDIKGGAARAAYRLMGALKKINIDTNIIVQNKIGFDDLIIGPKTNISKFLLMIRPKLDELIAHIFYRKIVGYFFPALIPDRFNKRIDELSYDILHLHWIAGGFIKIETLKLIKKPIVWTLHDFWAFTGGCNLPENCSRFQNKCGQCPVLGSRFKYDLSFMGWVRKNITYSKLNLTIVSPSNYLAKKAKESSLFKNFTIKVIPNCIDIQKFSPKSKSIARELIHLPEGKKIVLAGAVNITDYYKGHYKLLNILKILNERDSASSIEVILIGQNNKIFSEFSNLHIRDFGYLHDELSLSILLSAVDLFIIPSLVENFPNMVIEAMACGTPCVAFNQGGIPDIIDHKLNGYLAEAFNESDFVYGIDWILLHLSEKTNELSRNARLKVESTYEESIIAKKYQLLYENILKKDANEK
ncbi:MAG: glycosyltransferase [Melioribacteraceae bacterium]